MKSLRRFNLQQQGDWRFIHSTSSSESSYICSMGVDDNYDIIMERRTSVPLHSTSGFYCSGGTNRGEGTPRVCVCRCKHAHLLRSPRASRCFDTCQPLPCDPLPTKSSTGRAFLKAQRSVSHVCRTHNIHAVFSDGIHSTKRVTNERRRRHQHRRRRRRRRRLLLV